MSNLVEHRKFVCTDALNNNNKFWEYKFFDDDTIIVTYGRVGKTSTTDPAKPMSRSKLDSTIRSKLRGGKDSPPYTEIVVVSDNVVQQSSETLKKEVVKEAAISQLAGNNKELSSLIERLVEANRHELAHASGGQMDIDLNTGIISTPIGVITKDNISEARNVLNSLSLFVQNQDFDDMKYIENLNSYLRLVPQKVGHARGWHRQFFDANNTLVSQSTLLDQLESSADLAEARKKAATDSLVKDTLKTTPNIFDSDLKEVTDSKIIKMIEKMYKESMNSVHVSKNLRPIRFYEVRVGHADKAFQDDGAKMKNVWMLWHGTRIFNVLSILKNSLIVPKSGGSYHVTGRMFGDGVYASDQSTKALNYSFGYWDGSKRDKNCFMFLVDMAMGEYYTPKSSYESLPKKGYDSTYAIGGKSGVMNNEMIVYRTSQVNPRYLIEFEEK